MLCSPIDWGPRVTLTTLTEKGVWLFGAGQTIIKVRLLLRRDPTHVDSMHYLHVTVLLEDSSGDNNRLRNTYHT